MLPAVCIEAEDRRSSENGMNPLSATTRFLEHHKAFSQARNSGRLMRSSIEKKVAVRTIR